jgi:hypothetical protein
MRRDGVILPAESARLGHASPAITLGVDLHAMPDSDDAAALQAESALQKNIRCQTLALVKESR